MDIIISGAIPHGITAKASEAYIEKQAPALTHLLQTHRASQQQLDIATLGCTPFEYYQLEQAGYLASGDSFYAKGLAPLRCPSHFSISNPSEPIYLIELTHVEIGLHSASLYLSEELQISPQESDALFKSVYSILQDSPYQLLQHHGHIGLMSMGENFTTPLMSPALLATGYLNDWQTPSDLPRPLRNVLSELQITLHTHPINLSRMERGMKPINSAWIYGGATQQNFRCYQQESALIIDTLAFSHLHQDWEKWLRQLPILDQHIQPLLNKKHRFILCGFDRLVTLNPQPWWSKLIYSKQAWKQWWSISN